MGEHDQRSVTSGHRSRSFVVRQDPWDRAPLARS
jgi:hypothetical protein